MTLHEVLNFFEVKKQRDLAFIFNISEKAISKWALRGEIPLKHQIIFAKASNYFLFISLNEEDQKLNYLNKQMIESNVKGKA